MDRAKPLTAMVRRGHAIPVCEICLYPSQYRSQEKIEYWRNRPWYCGKHAPPTWGSHARCEGCGHIRQMHEHLYDSYCYVEGCDCEWFCPRFGGFEVQVMAAEQLLNEQECFSRKDLACATGVGVSGVTGNWYRILETLGLVIVIGTGGRGCRTQYATRISSITE